MLSNKPNIAIIGSPRSGTKLLADTMVQQGYHNFGEFFEVTNSEITWQDLPKALRLQQNIQFENLNSKKENIWISGELYNQTFLIKDRVDIFRKYENITPTTVTVFGFTIMNLYPELIKILDNRVFLCTRRANIFDQLLSSIITYRHKNWDGESQSGNISIDLDNFRHRYINIKRIERFQDFMVAEGKGRIIDFDRLITGTEDLGFDYKVTTTDQHTDLESLIINIDQVRARFNDLQSTY